MAEGYRYHYNCFVPRGRDLDSTPAWCEPAWHMLLEFHDLHFAGNITNRMQAQIWNRMNGVRFSKKVVTC